LVLDNEANMRHKLACSTRSGKRNFSRFTWGE